MSNSTAPVAFGARHNTQSVGVGFGCKALPGRRVAVRRMMWESVEVQAESLDHGPEDGPRCTQDLERGQSETIRLVFNKDVSQLQLLCQLRERVQGSLPIGWERPVKFQNLVLGLKTSSWQCCRCS